jgi:Cu-Zn family superoxide dismutase
MFKSLKFIFILSTFLIAISAGCSNQQSQSSPETMITKAIAVIHPLNGSTVHGIVTFTKVTDGIQVVADVEGLTPGEHGFHIHEYGDCSAPDGSSAGGHFNPEGKPHGGPDDAARHVGDMGNLTADETGHAHLEYVDHLMSFSGSHNIIGRGIIIHANPDDLKSQPSGNAGPRIACGVIGIAKG